ADVDTERGPGAGGRVTRIAPPVRRVHVAEVVVADIGVHVEDAPERTAFEQEPHLLQRRLVAALMADAEHATLFRRGGEDALGARSAERQRLFAEHLLAGGESGKQVFCEKDRKSTRLNSSH